MPMARLRFSVRRLWLDRSLTLVVLAILALGIGANTALFTVVNAVLLEPLRHPSPDRLVALCIFVPRSPPNETASPAFSARQRYPTRSVLSVEGDPRALLLSFSTS
jgi:hypothetical protein